MFTERVFAAVVATSPVGAFSPFTVMVSDPGWLPAHPVESDMLVMVYCVVIVGWTVCSTVAALIPDCDEPSDQVMFHGVEPEVSVAWICADWPMVMVVPIPVTLAEALQDRTVTVAIPLLLP